MKIISGLLLAALLTAANSSASATALEVDLQDKKQPIDGFGTCLMSWSKYPEETYTKSFVKIYAEDMGLNILRCELGGGTLPEKTAPEDMDYKKFKLEGYSGAAEIFLDFAKELKSLNPDAKIIGSVWTPPGWMKKHGQGASDPLLSKNGKNPKIGSNANTYGKTENYVTKEHYPHFVAWLVQMAKMFEAQGTPLYAVSPANEAMFTQWFQSCMWTADDYAEIVALLGKAFEKEGMDIKIFGPETMTGHNFAHGNPRYLEELKKGEPAKYLDIWASHGYEDGIKGDMSASSPAQFWNLIKDTGKPYWVTEGGTGGHEWPAPLSDVAAAIHNNFVHGNASAFVPWQITENKRSEHGLMFNHEMTKKSQAVRHFSTFVDDGAIRVAASPSEDDGLASSAYHHPVTGDITVVLINSSAAEKPVDLTIKGASSLAKMDAVRTSADEDLAKVDSVSLSNGKGSFTIPALSMVTLSGKVGGGGNASAAPARPEPLDAPRTWTNSEGQTIEAALIQIVDAETVLVRRTADNIDFALELSKLSEADREYVKNL